MCYKVSRKQRNNFYWNLPRSLKQKFEKRAESSLAQQLAPNPDESTMTDAYCLFCCLSFEKKFQVSD